MKLPEHVSLTITHNPHRGVLDLELEVWLDFQASAYRTTDADLADIRRTGEAWTVWWWQAAESPQGVIAATLERALELATAGARAEVGAGEEVPCARCGAWLGWRG